MSHSKNASAKVCLFFKHPNVSLKNISKAPKNMRKGSSPDWDKDIRLCLAGDAALSYMFSIIFAP
jgi:hypothetical protein